MDDLFNGRKRDKAAKGPRTFKMKRAQIRHLETLQEIAAQRKTDEEPRAGTSSQSSGT